MELRQQSLSQSTIRPTCSLSVVDLSVAMKPVHDSIKSRLMEHSPWYVNSEFSSWHIQQTCRVTHQPVHVVLQCSLNAWLVAG